MAYSRRAKSDSAPPRGAGWKQDSGPGQRRDVPRHDRSTDDTAHALATYTGPFWRSARLGPLPPYKGEFSPPRSG
ncbi:hypothetical protein EJ02DRAFT_248709 [Clathrospora elynae]|uniref:Uncharacterized protein n=1 Tax=Clathrospora elynae TaxID=706981 RepID=A0A6A5T2L9_9PLEO|nr:hypothetical protein EJ02DRAFT_248709 [Clathrospora elynae]